jgi:dimethylamine corrinoid protein
MSLFEEIIESTIAGDADQCASLAKQVVEKGLDPFDAIQDGFSKGMEIVGEKFAKMEIYLPELMQCADAMKAAMNILTPEMKKNAGAKKRGTIVLGTIQGDLHDLGKNIVRTMMEASGFIVHDLGCDVSVRTYIEKAGEVDADIIAASAILTTTMAYMPDLSRVLGETGEREKYKILLGGGPVTREYAKEADADGYAENAAEGVKVAHTLFEETAKGGSR